MAVSALGISGRLEEGEVLQASVLGLVTGLQWQAFVNGTWVNVGAAGNQTYTIPAGAAGTAYRLAGSDGAGTIYSLATGAAFVDSRKAAAPVLTGPQYGLLVGEGNLDAAFAEMLTLTDADKGHYGGGSLVVQNSNSSMYGGDGLDVLSIRFDGTQAGQFSYNAATREVLYAFTSGRPVVIGTLDAALDGNGTDLKVSFNANATAAVVNALTDALRFGNEDDSPVSRLLTYRVTDPAGASVQRAIFVEVMDSADAPVFASAASFTVDENQADAGVVAAVDPDREASAPQGISYSLAAGDGDADNARFEIDAASGALRFLTAADYEDAQHAPTYSVRVRATDSEGSTAEQVITVAVRDVNEAPVAANMIAYAREDGPAVTIVPVYSDPDAGDSHTVTFDASNTVGNVSFDGQAFTYDAAGRFEQLSAYSSATETFTFTVTDAAGVATTRTVTVNVLGDNDAASMSGTTTGAVTEDAGPFLGGWLQATGVLTVTDIDQGESQLYPPTTDNTGPGDFLVAGSQWRYLVDNNAVQYLGAGQALVDSIVVTSMDGTASRLLEVTITGANDAPVILAGGHLGEVTEAGAAGAGAGQASGSLAATDVDAGDTQAWSGSANGAYGHFEIDAVTGAWTYSLDDAAPATQALAQGQTAVDTFTATVTDAFGAGAQRQVQVTVHGANDAPEFAGGDTQGTVTESSPDGKLVLEQGIAGGIYGITTDAEGRLLIVGESDNPWGRSLWRFNEDGSADTAFGNGGSVFIESSTAFEKVAVDSAGRYVVGGQIYNAAGGSTDVGLARYLQDGTLDTSFGAGGVVMIDYGGGYDYATQIIARPDGGLLVVGDVQTDPQSNMVLGLMRLGADGSLDAGFGNGGKMVFTPPSNAIGGFQAAVDAQGRITIWGNLYSTDETNPGPFVYMTRLLSDGTTDTSFGDQGVVEFALDGWYANRGSALVLDDAGGLVLGWGAYTAEAGYHARLTRFDDSGALDASFGGDGTVATGLVMQYGGTFALSRDAQGKLLVAPWVSDPAASMQDFKLARFNADGTVDTSFGTGGVVTTDMGSDDHGEHLIVGADGTILLAGNTSDISGQVAALARYNADGSLDTTFGGPPDQEVWGWLQANDADGPSWPTWSGSTDGVYGEFVLDQYGGWTYRLDNSRAATQALEQGQTATETFVATASDAYGASVTQEIVITIVGTYDPPSA